MAKRSDIDKLRERVGTFNAPIGSVQLPATGIRYDKRGEPKALQSGQDEHPDPDAPRAKRPKKRIEPELAFSSDVFVQDPAERAVLSTCHKALAGKFVTEHELRTKLIKAEHDPELIEQGIEKCRLAGLIDDARYANQYVESRLRRGQGAQRIRQDLYRRGIDRALVDPLLAEARDDGVLAQGAIDAARKKVARIDVEDAKARAKVMRWLCSRGYSTGEAADAVRVVRQERADAGT